MQRQRGATAPQLAVPAASMLPGDCWSTGISGHACVRHRRLWPMNQPCTTPGSSVCRETSDASSRHPCEEWKAIRGAQRPGFPKISLQVCQHPGSPCLTSPPLARVIASLPPARCPHPSVLPSLCHCFGHCFQLKVQNRVPINPTENNWISCLKLLQSFHSAYGDLHLVPRSYLALMRAVQYKHSSSVLLLKPW